MKRILLLANAFPYGSWEPYLTNEIPYLCDVAEVSIFSLMLRKEQLAEKRELSPRVRRIHEIFFARSIVYLLWAFRALFDANLYREIVFLLRHRRLSLERLKILFVFLARVHYEKRKILRILRKDPIYSPDDEVIIYAYRFAYQPYLASLIKNYFTGGKIRLVARAHGSDLYENTVPTGYIPLREKTIGVLDQIHLVSNHGYEYLRASFPAYADKYCVSHLGVKRNTLRKKPKDCETLQILTCSTLTPGKRLHLLVESLRLIEDFPVYWQHFGEGPLAEEIQREAKNLPKNIKVIFHGQVDNSEITDFFAGESADFLVNISESEGIPVSIMESLASGTPVIATDVGGNGEIVKNNVNGFLIEAAITAPKLAFYLRKLQEVKEEEYAEMVVGAYESWKNNWDLEQNYLSFSQGLFKTGCR